MFNKTKRYIANIINKPHLLFVFVSLIFGFFYVFFTPPLQGPDEQAHFAQVYAFATGDKKVQQNIPKSIKETYQIIFYNDDIRFMSTERYETYRTQDARALNLNKGETVENNGFLTGTGYSPIGYLFSIIGVFIGVLFNAAPVDLIYLARIFSLIGWVILFAMAIKTSPVGKWAFFVAGILPMTLFQASVVSVDSMMFSTLAIFVAYTLYLSKKDKSLSLKDIVVLTVFGVAATLSKQVAIFILPVALLLCFNLKQTNKAESKIKINTKNALLIIGLLGVASILMLIWTRFGGTLNGTANLPTGVVPSEQVKNLIFNPTEFTYALRNTFFLEWGEDVSRSFIGTFGWMDTKMTIPVISMGYVLLFLSLISNRGDDLKQLPIFQKKLIRTGLMLIVALFWLVVTLVLYVYYTPVNFNIIYGLQGRYYLPIILILIPLFINKDQLYIKQNTKTVLLVVMPVVLLSISCLYLFTRYYINTII